MKVAVGLSGGVDSSVTALLLKRQGHEVTGITMSLWGEGARDAAVLPKGRHSCFGPDEAEDIEDARAVSAALGIDYQVFDCSAEYREMVLEDYRSEYVSGRTPNPCVRCNSRVKFGMLLHKARSGGVEFERFATGHYARTDRDAATGRHLLRMAADRRKDQSYFLYRLDQEQLATALFPLGGMSKQEVRRIAAEAGLPVSAKAESQDFYPGDHRVLIGQADARGPVVDTAGRVVGTHAGIWNYTRGQRRGIGVSAAEPLYVVDLRSRENTVVVGTRREASASRLTASRLSWISRDGLSGSVKLKARIRSTHEEAPATVSASGSDRVDVVFDEPVLAISPGQSVVFYDDDLVVGGGVIDDPGL